MLLILLLSFRNVPSVGMVLVTIILSMIFMLGFNGWMYFLTGSDAFLFGEAQGRVVVSVSETRETEFIDFMVRQDIPFFALGHVTKGEIRIDDISYGFICDMKKEYDSVLERYLEQD